MTFPKQASARSRSMVPALFLNWKRRVNRWLHCQLIREAQIHGHRRIQPMSTPSHPALEPVSFAGLLLRNRLAVAPMTRVSTAGDGVPTEAMKHYYAGFARGGFG